MCKHSEFRFIYLLRQKLWYVNRQNQKLIQSCNLIKCTNHLLKQGILWWTTGKSYFFSELTYINLFIVINAGTVFVLFHLNCRASNTALPKYLFKQTYIRILKLINYMWKISTLFCLVSGHQASCSIPWPLSKLLLGFSLGLTHNESMFPFVLTHNEPMFPDPLKT